MTDIATLPAEVENDDGWTDWIHPEPGYVLECCDCGLRHRMDFRIAAAGGDWPLNDGETADAVVSFRASRTHAEGDPK